MSKSTDVGSGEQVAQPVIVGAWDDLGFAPSYETGAKVYEVTDEGGERFCYVAETRWEALREHEGTMDPDDWEDETWKIRLCPAEEERKIGFPYRNDVPAPLAERAKDGDPELDAWGAYVTATCAEWAALAFADKSVPSQISTTVW